jgi:hypothetical protein
MSLRDDVIANACFFTQAILASQSQTLTWLSLNYIHLNLKSPVLLPNLQTLEVFRCRVEGWDNLCRSVPALKHLCLDDAIVSGGASAFPASALLEELLIDGCHDFEGVPVPWLSAYSKSFPSLRFLETDVICADTLSNILKNSHNLEEFSCYSIDDNKKPTDQHLAVICQLARPSLRSLNLTFGNFSHQGLEHFIASFPVSVRSLTLMAFSSALTLSLFRSLVQLPLRTLDLTDNTVSREDLEELESIANAKKQVGLEIFMFNLKITQE